MTDLHDANADLDDQRLPLQMYADEVPSKPKNRGLFLTVIAIFIIVAILTVVAGVLWSAIEWDKAENPKDPEKHGELDDGDRKFEKASKSSVLSFNFDQENPQRDDSYGLDPALICEFNGNYLLYERHGKDHRLVEYKSDNG